MFTVEILKKPIAIAELKIRAAEGFGDMVKAVVDVEKKIVGIGGELHVDIEIALVEQEGTKREHAWGINLYPEKTGSDFLEFDSMINLKPGLGNRTRNVDDEAVRQKIKAIVQTFVI